MSRLAVTSVVLTNFGGSVNRPAINLPSKGLVVIEGPNEAGKSTIVEAVAWLLADPTADSAAVARMGDRGERLQAQVAGTLAGAPFQITSTFEVMAARRAVRRATSVELDGATTTIELFHQRIGIADPTVFHSVFRVEGADGHQDGAAKALVATAGAGVFTGPDPRKWVTALETRAKDYGPRRAEGHESVWRKDHEIDELAAQLGAAAGQTAEFEQAVADEDAATAASEVLVSQISVLRQREAAFSTAELVIVDSLAAQAAQAQLDQIAQVPASWEVLAEDPAALRTLADKLDQEGPALRRVVADGAAAAERQGRTLDELAALAVAEEAVGSLTALANAASDAAANVSSAAAVIMTAESELASAHTEASRRIGTLGDAARTTGFDPTTAILDDTHHLNSLATEAAGAAQQLTALEDAARTASHAVTHHEMAHDQARERFSSLSGGLSVDDVLRGAGAQAPVLAAPAPTKSYGAAWFAPAAFVLLAVGGFATRSYVLGGAALALAAVAVVFALQSSRPHRVTAAGGASAAPVGPSEAVRDAALRVYNTQKTLDDARSASAQSVGAVDAARATLTSRQAELEASLEQARLPVGTDATEVAGLVERWRAAARATEEWRAAKKAVADAVAGQDVAVAEQQAAEAALVAALAPLGIVAGTGPEVANTITALRNDIAAAQAARAAQGTLDDLTSRVAALLAPVGLGPQDAVSAVRTAEHHADTLATRTGLASKVAELTSKVQAACDASTVVKDLVAGHPDTEQLKQEQRLVTEQIADLEAQKQQHDVDAADARAIRNSLLDTDAVTALEEQVQALDADANDLAVEAVAAALAHLVLREEVANEEQTRRPALVERTSEIATAVAAPWNEVLTLRRDDGSSGFDLKVLMDDGQAVPAHQLSTGARMVLYLALRVAVADDRTQGGVALPLLCDDPLVNIDPQRAPEVMTVLAEAAKERQVIITTCHPRTAELAEQAGGKVVRLGQ